MKNMAFKYSQCCIRLVEGHAESMTLFNWSTNKGGGHEQKLIVKRKSFSEKNVFEFCGFVNNKKEKRN